MDKIYGVKLKSKVCNMIFTDDKVDFELVGNVRLTWFATGILTGTMNFLLIGFNPIMNIFVFTLGAFSGDAGIVSYYRKKAKNTTGKIFLTINYDDIKNISLTKHRLIINKHRIKHDNYNEILGVIDKY